MIHLTLNSLAIDLELEFHKQETSNEFIDYIYNWVKGAKQDSKHGYSVCLISDSDKKLFCVKLKKNEYFRGWIMNNYDDSVLNSIDDLLDSFMESV